MRTSENAFRMTVFFGRPEPPDGQIAYGGTAFAVVHKEDGYGFGYLVTARHVAEQVVPNGEIVVRVNTPDKKSQDIPIDEIKWSYHPDPTVDVAVTGPKLSRPDFDIAYYNLADLVVPSSSEFRVQCGDPICIVGLFHWHVGATRNKPIVHSGTIAMLPDETEKIPLKNRTTGKRQDVVAYLVEAQTFDGLSGAPVFHREMVTLKESNCTAKALLLSLDWDQQPVSEAHKASGLLSLHLAKSTLRLAPCVYGRPNAFPTRQCQGRENAGDHLAFRVRVDLVWTSTAKKKAAPKGGFRKYFIYQYFILVAGIGFEPMTFRL